MPSQEKEQQDVQEDFTTIGSEGERHSGQREGPRQQKKKKKKKKKKTWSPVSRHHVAASLVARSRAARASPAAMRTSPAAMRISPAVMRTPTFIDNDYVTYSGEHS